MARFTLTQKTAIFVVITLAVIITLRVGSARLIILKEFVSLEADLTRQNMHQLLAAVESEYQGLARIMAAWGAWTDTLAFIQEGNPNYVKANLTPDTFTNLKLDLIMLADTHGRLRWAGSLAENGMVSPSLDPALQHHLLETAALWDHSSVESRRAGLLQTSAGLMLVAAGPVVNSDREGSVAGTIVMARRFGSAAVAALTEMVHMAVRISPYEEGPAIATAHPQHHPDMVHSPIHLTVLDDNRLKAATVIWDLTDKPTIELAAEFPRQVVAQGRRTINYFLFWQAVSGVTVTFMAILFMRRVILLPITRLNRQVAAISASTSFSDRLEVSTTDEVGETSQAINQMLSSLEAANTKLQSAYDELKETQAQLIQSAKLASIGEMAAGVAHELNQPLMVIRGTAQMIGRSQDGAAPNTAILPDQLHLIERNTKRMMNIIEHLRAFSRESDSTTAPTDINKIIKDCLILLEKQLRVHTIDVTLALRPDLPAVLGNQNQLEQVFINLITNAQDAILQKRTNGNSALQGRLQVTTGLAADRHDVVEVRIQDNGCGIATDQLDWIFDPFFTTKAVGQGTGLGLSISYGIIQGHDGSLRVEQTSADGSVFLIELPAGTVAKVSSAIDPAACLTES
ncbi:MAG: CHASE4 domain-containing protein [Desulfosarcinaceae bacterium]|nr:CHASE4 domain-containing protein [Desulfosarcinaceae bacterium]